MDNVDRKILSVLQTDGAISMARLSEVVGLSVSACHRRVKILETDGVIQNYAARLNRKALGLELQVFIEAKLVSERRDDMEAFEAACAGVWLHAQAGLMAAAELGSTAGVLAGDLIEVLPWLLPE